MARGKGAARQAQQAHKGEEEEAPFCPLCIEPLDNYEQSWYPCSCGYQICSFCRGRIRDENDNKCPGCRTEYDSNKDPFEKAERVLKASPARAQPKSSPRRVANGMLSPRSPTGHPDDAGARAARGSGSPPLANGSLHRRTASKELPQRSDTAPPAPWPAQAQEQQPPASTGPVGSSRQCSPERSRSGAVHRPDAGAANTQQSEASKPRRSEPQDAAPAGDFQRQQSAEASSAGSSTNRGPATQPADSPPGKASSKGGGGVATTTAWAQSGQPAASKTPGSPLQRSTTQRAEAIGVISPTSWPNLPSTLPPPAPRPPAAPKGNAEQSSPGSLSQAFQRLQRANSGKAGQPAKPGKASRDGSAARALWDSVLPTSRGEPDAQGSALREQVCKAVSEGQLTARSGASRLVSYIASKQAAMKPLPLPLPLQAHASPVTHSKPVPGTLLAALQQGSAGGKGPQFPQKSQELANGYGSHVELAYPHAASNGNGGLGNGRDLGYGSGLVDSRQGSETWLQGGLGLSLGSGSGQLGSLTDLWGRSNKLSPSPSIWASQRLDADAVPEPLQELWAKPSESSSAKQQRGPFAFSSNRTSSDSLASGFSGVPQQDQQHTLGSSFGRSDFSTLLRPPQANGFTSTYGQGLGFQQLPGSQAPSYGLGLGDQYSLWSNPAIGPSQLGGGQSRGSQGQAYDLGQRFDDLGSGLFQH